VRVGLETSLQELPDGVDLRIGASLNLTAGMYRALKYAVDKQKASLAMLWLSAILESREPITRAVLDARYTSKFGMYGDHGVVLDIYQSFLDEEKICAKNGVDWPTRGLPEFCKRKELNAHWYHNVHHRIEVVSAILQGFNVQVSTWAIYDQWTWAAIEDALLCGDWRNVAAHVPTGVGDNVLHYATMYHALGPVQATALEFLKTSLLYNGPSTMLPDLCLYTVLEARGSKRLMKHCCSISAEAYTKWSSGLSNPSYNAPGELAVQGPATTRRRRACNPLRRRSVSTRSTQRRRNEPRWKQQRKPNESWRVPLAPPVQGPATTLRRPLAIRARARRVERGRGAHLRRRC